MKRLLSLLTSLQSPCMACGRNAGEHSEDADHEHGQEEGSEDAEHHDHGEEAAGARFAEGKGLMLLDETKKPSALLGRSRGSESLPDHFPGSAGFRSAAEPSRQEGEQINAYATALGLRSCGKAQNR